MKIKKIKTKKIKKLIKSDIVIILICLMVSFFKMIQTSDFYTIVLSYKIIIKLNPILGISLLVYEILRNTFIIWIIYVPYRIALKNRIIKNIRYEVINNIEYYRDEFSNLSPAEISIIADLDIEVDKDIAATILKLYGKKYIDFENEKIVIKNENTIGLKKSEQQIMLLISNGNLNMLERRKWKEIALQEAIEDGYIKKDEKVKKKKHFWVSTILILFSIYSVINSIMDFTSITPDEINELKLYEQENNNKEIAEKLETNGIKESYDDVYNYINKFINSKYGKYYIDIIFDIISIVINIGLIFALIVYKVFRCISFRRIENCKYIRTELGKKLTEEIAAMQRYIHEFSLLSEKERKDVELWEDFLVYAVILEENTKIVKEIFTFKNMDSDQFYKMVQN